VKQVIRQAGHSYLSTLDGKQLLKLLDSQLSASMTAVRLQTAPVALTVAFAALALIAVQLVSDIGILYLAAQPKAIPHIVEVDKLGRPAYLGPLDRAAYRDFKPSTASIHYHLARFVRDTREITSDLAVLKRNWVDAYKLLTTNGSNFLNAYVQDHNPFQVVAAQVRVAYRPAARGCDLRSPRRLSCHEGGTQGDEREPPKQASREGGA